MSFGGGSSTDQSPRDIGGYPHSGQGDPSGITAKVIASRLATQKAKRSSGLDGVKSLAYYPTMDDTNDNERGRGFGGVKMP
jgi:hypothetical protein